MSQTFGRATIDRTIDYLADGKHWARKAWGYRPFLGIFQRQCDWDDPRATLVCAKAALSRSAAELYGMHSPAFDAALDAAEEACMPYVRKAGFDSIPRLNDELGHAAVMEMLRDARERA